jgi:pimeloyl-ACP methyl ester carboxylesterase
MRQTKLRLILAATLVTLVGILASACSSASEHQPPTAARFDKGPCLFLPGPGVTEGTNLTCGMLNVPEDRQHPATSRRIRLAVAIFSPPTSPAAGNPVVYLGGGPGVDVIKPFGPNIVPSLIAQEFGNRELILLDQRGTGLSDPSLRCPEQRTADLAALEQNLSSQDTAAAEQRAFQACSARLTQAGAQLAAYTTANDAADVHDLLAALGIPHATLWGVSYGTRLALEVMRAYPDRIASVVLDSTYPPQANQFVTAAVDVALGLLHDADLCTADTACHQEHPDVLGRFLADFNALNATPHRFSYFNMDDNRSYTLNVTGAVLASALLTAMYSTQGIAQIPALIDQVSQGQFTLLDSLVAAGLAQDDAQAEGMYLSVECAEDAPFATADAINKALDALPPSLRALVGPRALTEPDPCKAWPVPAVPAAEKQPISSAIPTLLFEGGLDPITPVTYGAAAAETLSHSYQAFFPYATHGVQFPNDCAASITRAFLDQPQARPDMSCIAVQPPLTFS